MAKPKGYHHGNLREALIAAGLEALAEDGPSKFSLRDVARRAGVSATAPYRHFADKESLFGAIAVESYDRMRAKMDEALAEAPDDPLERFRATGIAYVKFAVAHPQHFLALSMPGVLGHVPMEQRQSYETRFLEERAAIAKGQEDGTITKMPLDQLFLTANAVVRGLAHMIISGELGVVTSKRAAELAEQATHALGVGLYPRT